MQICLPSNSKEEILVCYFRMAKSLNSSLVIVLSFLNSHLSILDFGLPVSFNHLFLENKNETTKHLLITTTTKTFTYEIAKLPNRAKNLKPQFARKQAFKVHHHCRSSLSSTKSTLSSSSPSLTSSPSSLFPA